MSRRLPEDWFPGELPAGLELGQRSFLISSYAFLHCAASATIQIGNDTGIYHGTFFELGPAARVKIGNFCSLVGAVVRAESEVHIGDYALIAHEVVITDCETRSKTRNPDPHPIRIGDDVWIGMRAVILAGVTIGDGAVVGAGSVVNEDVPPMTIVSGNPARVVRTIDL